MTYELYAVTRNISWLMSVWHYLHHLSASASVYIACDIFYESKAIPSMEILQSRHKTCLTHPSLLTVRSMLIILHILILHFIYGTGSLLWLVVCLVLISGAGAGSRLPWSHLSHLCCLLTPHHTHSHTRHIRPRRALGLTDWLVLVIPRLGKGNMNGKPVSCDVQHSSNSSTPCLVLIFTKSCTLLTRENKLGFFVFCIQRVNRNRYCAIQYRADIRYPLDTSPAHSSMIVTGSLSLGRGELRAVVKTVMSPPEWPGLVTVFPHHVPPPELPHNWFPSPALWEKKFTNCGAGVGILMAGYGLEQGWAEEERGSVLPQDRFLSSGHPYFTRVGRVSPPGAMVRCQHDTLSPLWGVETVETPNTDFCSAVMSLLLMGPGNSSWAPPCQERVWCKTQNYKIVSFFGQELKQEAAYANTCRSKGIC